LVFGADRQNLLPQTHSINWNSEDLVNPIDSFWWMTILVEIYFPFQSF
jgi:hypothetical protein